MAELYKGQAGSPITYLTADILASQTTISVDDDSALPDAPNICTIGYGENLETIKYGVKSNGVLQEVERGIEGTPQSWQKGTEVARFFTAYDHNAIIENFKTHMAEMATYMDNKTVLTFSRATNLVGAQQIELGFKPRVVHVLAIITGETNGKYWSQGSFAGEGKQKCIFKISSSGAHAHSGINAITLHSGSAEYYGKISLTDTGISINWGKSNNIIEGTIQCMLSAY